MNDLNMTSKSKIPLNYHMRTTYNSNFASTIMTSRLNLLSLDKEYN